MKLLHIAACFFDFHALGKAVTSKEAAWKARGENPAYEAYTIDHPVSHFSSPPESGTNEVRGRYRRDDFGKSFKGRGTKRSSSPHNSEQTPLAGRIFDD